MKELIGIGRFEQTIRHSRFIGVCGPVHDEDAARAFIETHGTPGCRHVCYAYRIGDHLRFDDAGEPGGTAGRPILAVLDHFELDRAIAVVSRFFGGIKLGTGGLARAYGGTARRALEATPMRTRIETMTLCCRVPFDASADLHRLLEQHGGTVTSTEWKESGLELALRLPRAATDTFCTALTEATRADARIQRLEDDD